jgi:hypothetical protein
MVVAALLAALSAVLGAGLLTGLVPPAVTGWLLVAEMALTVGLGVFVQGVVTPVISPQDNLGRALVPERAPR